jgi:hypothetical protein
MSKGKECTARVRIFKELRIPLVYTLEASFFGQKRTNRSIQTHSEMVHFTIDDYKEIGR